MADTDHYSVLGIDRDDSVDRIRSAYRKAALRYHPDVSDDPCGADRFREATKAYEVLCDPRMRAAYNAQYPNAGRMAMASSDKQKGENEFLQEVDPAEGFDWAMARMQHGYPSLWSNLHLKGVWRARADEYWKLEGQGRSRGNYMAAVHLAAAIVFNENCISSGNGVGPAAGFEWAMHKVRMDFWMIWRKPEWKRRWRARAEALWAHSFWLEKVISGDPYWEAQAETHWQSCARSRTREDYLTPTVQAGRSVYVNFDEQRNNAFRKWWGRIWHPKDD